MIELTPHLILIVAVLVLVLMWALNLLLYRPILKALDERKEIVEGAARDAEAAKNKIAKLQEEYDQALQDVRRESKALYNRYREEALGQEKEILSGTHKEVERTLERAMTELEKNTDSAKEELRSYTESLAREVGSKILGRSFS